MNHARTGQSELTWQELDGHERHGACLIAARAGDRDALNALVADLTPVVWRIARSQGLAKVAAEDVTQTVWLLLLRNLHSMDEPRALVAWLITTTRREAIRAVRGDRQSSLPAEMLEEVATTRHLPEPEVLRRDRDRQLWDAFHRLSARCQMVLSLTVLAGRVEYQGVAQALEIPRGSVGPTRGRCLTHLRSLLTVEGGTP
ncbi:RNA polymerase sigma factor [Actinoalloteichus hymeniacidonis]|uniref:RNA polymerase sigma factor, sigma-70 family n=1 Tax=Actinoalloteichus hymeniacidonis TaxID=340345 RepID=A0AAC9HWN9_9PSEU|nr:sigma-70 family RNA polymerase sigma factor [Actinoalloteichus hymeniacidonis]AOS65855.1 RNA polymerase sigma factor, sigma-70 family [Actinoalloteichus hymeniacidonis]MBB5906051.1 RNA polymerase sigma factor (sigma-70 family) [Actinoalloteichus hymeniacidonis]